MSKDDPAASASKSRSEVAIPLIEETATVTKRQIDQGKVVVRTSVVTEERLLREVLSGERVTIERVPVDRVVQTAPEVRIEGNVTIVPIVEERLIVERQLVLVEEIHLHRHATQEEVDVPVMLRKQRAVIEKVDRDLD